MIDEFDEVIAKGKRSEKALLNDILCEKSINPPHGLVYRQNTGTAWQRRPVDVPIGQYIKVTPGMKILAEARPISFGLPGAGDATGTVNGRALQIETKTLTGAQRVTQQNFEKAWTKVGGIYILARTVPEFREKLKQAI